jgi:serine/threonine protein kinase
LTGHPPFEATTDAKILAQHMQTFPKRPSEITKNPIPPLLEKIVMTCLEKEMDLRYQTVSELANALAEVPLNSVWTQETAQIWWNRYLEAQQIPTKEEEIIPMEMAQAPLSSEAKISGQLRH